MSRLACWHALVSLSNHLAVVTEPHQFGVKRLRSLQSWLTSNHVDITSQNEIGSDADDAADV